MPRRTVKDPGARDWSNFIVRHTPGAVITVDAQGRITEFNPAAEKLTGFNRQEVLGQAVRQILHCQEQEEPGGSLDLVLRGEQEVTQELVLTNRNGEQAPVMLSSFALLDKLGTPRGAAMIIRDLTLVKRMEVERRNLINMFAHDLKTPVVGVAGLIRRLLQGKVGPMTARQQEYLGTIDREMGRMEKLITRFLEFARLDLRILAPEPKAIDLAAECRQVIQLLAPLAEARGMELSMELPATVPELQADPLLLRRVLENLLENAIKYGLPNTQVDLEVREEPARVRFAVRNQGPGIPPEDLAHLFEVFYRGKDAVAAQGFGLGLATVKRIVDAHGGRIWVETGSGKGTTFFFTLPQKAAAAPDS